MNRKLPEWKAHAVKAARIQNDRQRAAAKPAYGGFSDCTTGAALSLINAYSAS